LLFLLLFEESCGCVLVNAKRVPLAKELRR
jgi:hypothetical protein